MHKRRIMALARSGLCRLPSSQTEAAALRAGFLPLLPRSMATAATSRQIDLYRLPSRSIPTTSLLRVMGGQWPSQVLLGNHDIWSRHSRACASNIAPIWVDKPSGYFAHLRAEKRYQWELLEHGRGYRGVFDKPQIPLHIKAALREHDSFGYRHLSPVQEAILNNLQYVDMKSRLNPEQEVDRTQRGEPVLLAAPPTDLLIRSRPGCGKIIAYLIAALTLRHNYLETMKGIVGEGFAHDPVQIEKMMKVRTKKVMGALILVPNSKMGWEVYQQARTLLDKTDWGVHLWISEASLWTKQRTDLTDLRPDIFIASCSRPVNGMTPTLRRLMATCPLVILDGADQLTSGDHRMLKRLRNEYLPPDHQQWVVAEDVDNDLRTFVLNRPRSGQEIIDVLDAELTLKNSVIPQHVQVAATAADILPQVIRLLVHDMLLHPKGGRAVVYADRHMARILATVMKAIMRALPWGDHTRVLCAVETPHEAARVAEFNTFSRMHGTYAVAFVFDLVDRGLEHRDLTRVIHLGLPPTVEDYAWRIGLHGGLSREHGRSDVVVYPWEADYVHDRVFGEHSLTSIDVEAFKKEVADLAVKAEAQTQAPPQVQQQQGRPTVQVALRPGERMPLPPGALDPQRLDRRGVKMMPAVAARLSQLDAEIRMRAIPALQETLDQHRYIPRGFNGLLRPYRDSADRVGRPFAQIIREVGSFYTEQLGMSGSWTDHLHNIDRPAAGLEVLSTDPKVKALIEFQQSEMKLKGPWAERKARAKERKADDIRAWVAGKAERQEAGIRRSRRMREQTMPTPTFRKIEKVVEEPRK